MKRTLSKAEIAASMAETVGISKKLVNAFFTAQAEMAYKHAKNSFLLPGIGKIILAKSKPREMVMQFGEKKGQTVKVPAKTRVKFRIAKAAKDAITGLRPLSVEPDEPWPKKPRPAKPKPPEPPVGDKVSTRR